MSDGNETLLPCPICGRRATLHSWWSNDEECGMASVGCARESYTNGYECARIFIMRRDVKTARRDAIQIWNTRAGEQAVAATLGRGECEIVASSTDGLGSDSPKYWFELSCGHSFTVDGLELPVACAVCGKAVKR